MKSPALNNVHHKINAAKADVAGSSSSVRNFQNEKSRFQSVFIRTIEKSQSDIAQKNRIKNSDAKDTGDAQPKMSSLNNVLSSSGRSARAARAGAQAFQIKNDDVAPGAGLEGSDLSEIEPLRFALLTTGMAEQSAGAAAFNQSLTTKFARTSDGSFQDSDEAALIEQDALPDSTYKSGTEVLSQSLQRIRGYESDQRHDSHPSPDTAHPSKSESALTVSSCFMPGSGSLHLSGGKMPINQSVLAGSPGTLIESRFGTTAWGSEVSQKIVWMMRGAEQSATLTLNPPNLGPLQVVVHVQNNIARASFFSNNSEVRLALLDGVPALREMMLKGGIELGQTQVKEIPIASAGRSDVVRRLKVSNEGLASIHESSGTVSGLLSTFA